MTPVFLVRAQYGQSSIIVGAADRIEAIRRANDLKTPRASVSITVVNGDSYAPEDFEKLFVAAEPKQGGAHAVIARPTE